MKAANSTIDGTKKEPIRFRKIRFIARLGLFGIGVVTVTWFFFSFISIIIGVLFFFADKRAFWKRHGLVLAFAGGLSQFLGHEGSGIAPLFLAMIGGFGVLGIYGLFCLFELFLRKNGGFREFYKKIKRNFSNLPRFTRFLIIFILVIFPIGLWGVVSLNFQVMFDNKARVLWIHGPSTANLDENLTITVEAWDQFERLSATYKGTISFSIQSFNFSNGAPLSITNATLPLDYQFTGRLFGSDMAYSLKNGKDNGKHIFSVKIRTPGIHYLIVNDSFTDQQYYSNPILVINFSQNQPRLYWGDIHTHSMLSDGSGSPEHSFLFAREVACLDFYALTDHREILAFNPWGMDTLETTTQAAYVPHEFVTFMGIEWTNVRTGHYTLIFSGDQLLKKDINSYWGVTSPEGLWQVLDEFTATTGCRALALPHHTTKKAYIQDWTYLNPKYVKLAEISSVHGDFLYEQRHPLNYRGAIDPPSQYTNGSSITDALRMGYRLTLYSSSDVHDGHPGHSISHTEAFVGHQRPYSIWHTRNEHPYPGGITGAWTDELTREGIFTALENQQIFAVSDFGRPILNFSINGVGLGDGATLLLENATDNRTLSIFLAQDGAPAANAYFIPIHETFDPVTMWNASIEILKNGDLLTSIAVNTPVIHVNFTDSTPITGATYGVESCIMKNGQYYINGFSDNPIDPSLLNTNGVDFYMIRIVSLNGRMAWIGPIWVGVE